MTNLGGARHRRLSGAAALAIFFLPLSARALPYNAAQIEWETTANQRLNLGDTAWGDMDGDGDLDVVNSGQDSGGGRQFRVYTNGGPAAYTITNVQVDIFGAGNGLANGGIALGDMDGDGDLDAVITGDRGTAASRLILVARNNGALAFTQIVVDTGAGLTQGRPALGDFDNDGDLDLAVVGLDPAGARQLRVYRNNGDATFDATQIEVPGAANLGYDNGAAVAWGDFDLDADLDLAVEGQAAAGRRVHVYRNNGNGTFNATPIDPTGGVGGFSNGDVAWGDMDADGDLDLISAGFDGANSQVRVYRNNGNATFTAFNAAAVNTGFRDCSLAVGDSDNDGDLDIGIAGLRPATAFQEIWVYRNDGGLAFTAVNVEAGNNLGVSQGGFAWADYNNDNKIDILVTGILGANRSGRIYQNTVATANTAPNAPATLASTFTFSPSALSTATFKWDPSTDAGAGATPVNLLTYDVEVSSLPTFLRSVIPRRDWATPRRGNYHRPPIIFDGNTRHGVYLKSDNASSPNNAHPGLRTDTTYYFRVRSIDAGLLASTNSGTGTLWTGVAPATSTISDAAGANQGDIVISWLSAGDDANVGASTGAYLIQYSSNPATVWNPLVTPAGATTVTISTNLVPGAAQNATIALTTNDTYYFVMWTQDNANNLSAISNVTSGQPSTIFFSPVQIEVDGVNGGLTDSDVSLGDFDEDGDLDALVSGTSAGTNRQLRVYINTGGGVFNPTQIEVDGLDGGLGTGGVDFGDFDGDGDLDILATGLLSGAGTNPQLRVYRNNGGGTFDANQIEVDGLNGGLYDGDVKWGDLDNDGDLDILAAGFDSANNRQLRIYENNGNGTFDPNQIEVDGANNGLQDGIVEWGDFDGDGDQDLLIQGYTGGDSEIRVYRNNGDGTIDPNQISIDGAAAIDGYDGRNSADFGDYDYDGDLDILVEGVDGAAVGTSYLRVYQNNGDGTFNNTEVNVNPAGANGGNSRGGAQWGDVDQDGDLDIMVNGWTTAGAPQTRLFRNTGTGFVLVEVEPTAADELYIGSLAVGDIDGDGDLDFMVSGRDVAANNQLRWYNNLSNVANPAPNPPTVFATGFSFSPVGASTATFMWNEGTDNTPGATPEAGLSYFVQIATVPAFVPEVTSGYFDPPKTYDGGTKYGMILTSTEPWNILSANYGLRTDTTFYFRVKTVDAGLLESGFSLITTATSTLWTGVAPTTSTLAAAPSAVPALVDLSWNAAGDDLYHGDLISAHYRIQYSSNPLIAWSTSSTPSGAYTITLATTGVVPGTAQTATATVTTNDTYYFVIWTQDDVGNWSVISATASSIPGLINRSVTVLSGDPYNFGSLGVGVSSHSVTAAVLLNDGNVPNNYYLSAATSTAGTPWAIGSALPAATNRVVVSGAFHPTRPALGGFGAEDIISTNTVVSSGSVYTIDASTTGVSVPVGATRPLWFRMDMPTASDTAGSQSVTVTITAGP